ncbi:RHS repeat-associated core domain-containing protein [Celerinatantimonas sp. MCCC 1A17872]|uniref:RHS repeat-associated core domain-containing protein n=1 Tax=Celerinatantimonas sp. MCCC 1A17872 TaxID=3177514 RepID=UPI0038C08C51
MGIDDSHWGSERFELNRNGQITQRTFTPHKGSQRQFVTLFGYDSELNLNETASATQYTDNVVPISQAILTKEARHYDNAGRVVQVGRFTYHYDECGRAIQKVERKEGFRPQATRFTWDEHDRLTRIELPNGERWRYRYDAFGRRVAKECEQGAQASHQVHYLYDGAQVIQQTLKTANGEALQSTEYIYEPGSFRPVAQVDTNHTLAIEKLHYVVTDHAGTPRELCAEDGDIVWRGEQGLWHRHTQTLQSNVKRLFEDAANDPVHCDLRYQGQLEDKESGLYYNLNRYYDADSGQYLSSDPIGMLGGLRPQAYVHNPIEWVDPLGLTGHASATKKVKVYDVVDYRPSSSPLENHHGLLDIWAKHNVSGYVSRGKDTPTIALTKSQHDATKAVYRNWLKENYGKPVDAKVDWSKVSEKEMHILTEKMFNAAKVPQIARNNYYRKLNQYIYNR